MIVLVDGESLIRDEKQVMRVKWDDYQRIVQLASDYAQSNDRNRQHIRHDIWRLITTLAIDPRSNVSVIPGVGAKRLAALARLDLKTIDDCARYIPLRYEDRRQRIHTDTASISGRVRNVTRRGRRVSAELKTDSGTHRCLWFHRPYLAGQLKSGLWLGLVGKVKRDGVMIEPEIASGPASEPVSSLAWNRLMPVYSTTTGLSQRLIRELVAVCALIAACRQDPFPIRSIDMTLPRAVIAVHFPLCEQTAKMGRRRLVFEQLLGQQLWFELNRRARLNRDGISHVIPDDWSRLFSQLPFQLTDGQRRAVDEISSDLSRNVPMARLLVGDVGSGKTVVAMAAAYQVARSGHQVALLAPTDLVAHQHYETLSVLEHCGLRASLLTGGMDPGERASVLQDMVLGSVDVVIGTHALLSDDVVFARLGLVVIDEQHRFGVGQRQTLLNKGKNPDLLALSATPIPRTVALASLGHIDITRLKDLPSGRKPIQSDVVTGFTVADLDRAIKTEVANDGQVMIVCPRLESDGDYPAAVTVFNRLKDMDNGHGVELIHGRLERDVQREIVGRFSRGEVKVIVATSVIEVGVDVPAATLMVVLGADRFGLAQLHQLRGRIGRGDRQGRCLFVASDDTDADGGRLSFLVRSIRGMAIAIADLKMRGPGEVGGERQHGFFVNSSSPDLVRSARREARAIINRDPELNGEFGGAKHLLQSAGYDMELDLSGN